MSTKEKIIFHIIELGLLGLVAFCFNKAAYIQGGIDARQEMIEPLQSFAADLQRYIDIAEVADATLMN
jgi:hypothetical protein